MNDAPLLDGSDLRIDVGGSIAIENATFATSGHSVALLGDDQGIVAALGGTAAIRRGTLRLLGVDVEAGSHLAAGWASFAPLDPPLPPRWSIREYLVWGARLAGADRSAAERDATQSLTDFGLAAQATQRLDTLSLAERRALVLAQAIIARPKVLVAAMPLAGLGGREAVYVSQAWSAAAHGRKWVVSISNLHPGSGEAWLGQTADDVLLFASGRLVKQGRLDRMESGAVGYTLTVRARSDELLQALATRGVVVSGSGPRFYVELPANMKAQDLLNLSVDLGAAIIELVPRIAAPTAS